MGLYQEKLYEFLEKPENFDFAWEICEAMPGLKDRLRSETLAAFEVHATHEVKGTDWECWRPERDKVGISKKSWSRLFAVALYIGRQYPPAIGLWHNKDDARLRDRYDEILGQAAPPEDMRQDARNGKADVWYWPLSSNLDTLNDAKRLLPAYRQETVGEHWARLCQARDWFTPKVENLVS